MTVTQDAISLSLTEQRLDRLLADTNLTAAQVLAGKHYGYKDELLQQYNNLQNKALLDEQGIDPNSATYKANVAMLHLLILKLEIIEDLLRWHYQQQEKQSHEIRDEKKPTLQIYSTVDNQNVLKLQKEQPRLKPEIFIELQEIEKLEKEIEKIHGNALDDFMDFQEAILINLELDIKENDLEEEDAELKIIEQQLALQITTNSMTPANGVAPTKIPLELEPSLSPAKKTVENRLIKQITKDEIAKRRQAYLKDKAELDEARKEPLETAVKVEEKMKKTMSSLKEKYTLLDQKQTKVTSELKSSLPTFEAEKIFHPKQKPTFSSLILDAEKKNSAKATPRKTTSVRVVEHREELPPLSILDLLQYMQTIKQLHTEILHEAIKNARTAPVSFGTK